MTRPLLWGNFQIDLYVELAEKPYSQNKNVSLGTLILWEAGGIYCYNGTAFIPIRQHISSMFQEN